MFRIKDYLWEGKFQVEGLNNNKNVEFRRKCRKYKLGLLGELLYLHSYIDKQMNVKLNIILL